MLYQLSYASPSQPETSPNKSGNPRKPSLHSVRTHSRSARSTAQKSRLAHPRQRSKLERETRAGETGNQAPHNCQPLIGDAQIGEVRKMIELRSLHSRGMG